MTRSVRELLEDICTDTDKESRTKKLEEAGKKLTFLRYLNVIFNEEVLFCPALVDVVYKAQNVPVSFGDMSLEIAAQKLYILYDEHMLAVEKKQQFFQSCLESMQTDDADFFYKVVTKTYTPGKHLTKKQVFTSFPNLKNVRMKGL